MRLRSKWRSDLSREQHCKKNYILQPKDTFKTKGLVKMWSFLLTLMLSVYDLNEAINVGQNGG